MINIFRAFLIVFLTLIVTSCASNNTQSTDKSTIKNSDGTVIGTVAPPPVFSATSPAGTPATTDSNPSGLKTIALLLPMQGNLAGVSNAIKTGFMAAYNNAPTDARPAQVKVIDTSAESNIQAAYNKAVQDGASIVVGPLEKSQVQAIAQINNLSTPVLALNYLDTQQTSPAQFYQFGLSPLDEARQAAAFAKQTDLHSALIMAPDNSWGKGVANAFTDQWQAVGGKVAGTLLYGNSSQTLNKQIRNFLQANNNGGRRHDFDVIFLAASSVMGRQIKPLLKFYYAGDVPVYATALVYSGTNDTRLNSDLNGVIFCDAPWNLGMNDVDTNLRTQLNNSDQNANSSDKYYALGIDAYRIATQLNRLSQSSQQTLSGATGKLYLNDQHRIVRQLPCARFQSGAPVLINNE